MKKVLITLFICLFAVVSSGAILAGTGSIKIGLSAPITGNYAEFGENFRFAVQMAADKINAAGGIKGKKLEIVSNDSKGDPRESALIAQKFVQDKSILAEIGDFTSTSCLAAAPIYERNEMVQLSPTASHPDFAKSGKYMFGIVGTQDAEGPFNAKYLAQEYMGIKSVGIIYINNDWGVVTRDTFAKAARKIGLKVTLEQPFFEAEKDYNAVLTKIRESNPEGIYIAAMYNEASLIARQIRKMGWDVKLFAPSSVFSDNLLKLGGDAVEGLVTNTFFALSDPDPDVQAFIKEFQKRAGRNPNLHAACAYDSTMILAEAIRKGGFNRKNIQKALAKTKDFQGITGSITFTADGDVIRNYKVMIVENGQWVVKKDYTRTK